MQNATQVFPLTIEVGNKEVQVTEKDISRFWSKVEKSTSTECWEWKGVIVKDGYGRVRCSHGARVLTHRLSYTIHKGQVPSGMFVCHSCDNPCCVNPSHLWAGTHTDNMRDKITKGRANTPKGELHWSVRRPELRASGSRNGAKTKPECILQGEDHGCSKLTWEQVGEIRREYSNGKVKQSNLARRYSVGVATIHNIVKNKAWTKQPAMIDGEQFELQ
jgi:hypothetical protein